MTDGMLSSNHPADERLSALASHDTGATADAALTAHVSACDRCASVVREIEALRVALAEMPDVAPSRRLQILPWAEEQPSTVDRAGAWMRRVFAPVLTAGAALALVGLIGTTAGLPGGDAGVAAPEAGGGAIEQFDDAAEPLASAATVDGGVTAEASAGPERDFAAGESDSQRLTAEAQAERSPWPMILFTGVAVMVLAVLLRWILVPRAG